MNAPPGITPPSSYSFWPKYRLANISVSSGIGEAPEISKDSEIGKTRCVAADSEGVIAPLSSLPPGLNLSSPTFH